jgi:hypothetical protein
MIQAKQDTQDTQYILKKRRSRSLSIDAKVKASQQPKVYRKRCGIGLGVSKSMTYEELYKHLANFAAEQWEQLPKHASDWERGQIDGLFWAMDKLDELVEKE